MKPLSQDEKRILADLISRNEAEQAGLREAAAQAELRRQIDEQRAKPSMWEQNVAGDQAEYVAGRRGSRRTIRLSPEDAAPTHLLVDPIDRRLEAINKRLQELELVTKPAPQAVFQQIKKKIWNWIKLASS